MNKKPSNPIRLLIRQLASILEANSRSDERLYALMIALEELEKCLPPDFFQNANHPKVQGSPGVVLQIRCFKRPDGRWEFKLDDHRLILPGRLASLLIGLASDCGEAPDEFVGWKSRDQLRHSLGNGSGSPISAHALSHLVHRLQNALEDQPDLPRDLILRHRFKGLRLAVRRRPPSNGALPDPAGDSPAAPNALNSATQPV